MFDQEQQNKQIDGSFEIILDAPNGAKLRFSGYSFISDTEESLNNRIDTCRNVMIRQRNIMEKPIIENNLTILRDQVEKQKKAYASILEKQGNGKIASNEKVHLDNYPVQIKQLEKQILEGEKKLSEIMGL